MHFFVFYTSSNIYNCLKCTDPRILSNGASHSGTPLSPSPGSASLIGPLSLTQVWLVQSWLRLRPRKAVCLGPVRIGVSDWLTQSFLLYIASCVVVALAPGLRLNPCVDCSSSSKGPLVSDDAVAFSKKCFKVETWLIFLIFCGVHLVFFIITLPPNPGDLNCRDEIYIQGSHHDAINSSYVRVIGSTSFEPSLRIFVPLFSQFGIYKKSIPYKLRVI